MGVSGYFCFFYEPTIVKASERASQKTVTKYEQSGLLDVEVVASQESTLALSLPIPFLSQTHGA